MATVTFQETRAPPKRRQKLRAGSLFLHLHASYFPLAVGWNADKAWDYEFPSLEVNHETLRGTFPRSLSMAKAVRKG